MKGKGFYLIIIILLVLLNLGTLTFIWVHRPGRDINPMERRNVAEFLTRELELTPQQQKEFLRIRERHQQMMMVYQQQDQALHKRFFDLLLAVPTDTALASMIADSMALTRQGMEMLTFEHFSKIRDILSDEQKKKFDELFHETLKLVLPPPPPPPPPPPQDPQSLEH
jgi:periplasmic protein CpxP/Spy